MIRTIIGALAAAIITATPAAAKMDFAASDFQSLLEARFAHLWPDAKVALMPGNCEPTACWYRLGDKIKLRAYSLTGEHVHDVSATLDTGAGEGERNAFIGACLVILNIADQRIRGDDGLALAAKLANTNEREMTIRHGEYDLVGEKALDGRTCTVFPK